MKREIAFILAAALLACATRDQGPEPRVEPPHKKRTAPLPHSSIAAILEHHESLGLTDDQVAKLEALDRQLEVDNLAIRRNAEEASEKSAEAKSSDDPSRRDAEHGARGQGGAGDTVGGMGGMGGMGRRGMRGGMGRHGGLGGGGQSQSDRAPNPNSPEVIRQRIDDNDTAAYLEAEKLLTEEQRTKARPIAEQYRADLWDSRNGT